MISFAKIESATETQNAHVASAKTELRMFGGVFVPFDVYNDKCQMQTEKLSPYQFNRFEIGAHCTAHAFWI